MPVDFNFDCDNFFTDAIVEYDPRSRNNILKCKDKYGNIASTTLNDYSFTCSDMPSAWISADFIPKAEVKVKLTEPKICKCCGAVLHDKKCEYCGVEYNYKEV